MHCLQPKFFGKTSLVIRGVFSMRLVVIGSLFVRPCLSVSHCSSIAVLQSSISLCSNCFKGKWRILSAAVKNV